MVGNSLTGEERKQMVSFLRANVDVFAWQPYDMPGVDAEAMCHKLHINKNYKPVKQKPRRVAPEKSQGSRRRNAKTIGSWCNQRSRIPIMDIQSGGGQEEK